MLPEVFWRIEVVVVVVVVTTVVVVLGQNSARDSGERGRWQTDRQTRCKQQEGKFKVESVCLTQ